MEKKFKILIVDDDADTITTLSDLLKEHGYDVVSASDGINAVEMAEKEKPDLSLVDIRLPKLDGYEVCSKIKHMKGLNIKIILFTAYGDVVSVEKAKQVGADGFLGKTADFANMHRSIENLLNSS